MRTVHSNITKSTVKIEGRKAFYKTDRGNIFFQVERKWAAVLLRNMRHVARNPGSWLMISQSHYGSCLDQPYQTVEEALASICTKERKCCKIVPQGTGANWGYGVYSIGPKGGLHLQSQNWDSSG
jgi:hypothetical protein